MNILHTEQFDGTPTLVPAAGDCDMLASALAYARAGLAVFPIHTPDPMGNCSCGKANCSSSGKHPRTKNGLKAATTNELEIHRFYRDAPDANIGLPCGAVNDIFVLDVDGVEGESSLARLAEQYGPLSATRKVLTGKGYQLFFKYPGYKIRTAAPIDRGFPGLDSRGDGGYVVAPPSLHHTGKRYEIDSQFPKEIAEAPAWLIDFINRRPPKTPGAAAANADHDDFDEGSRNSRLASLAGSMRARGMTLEAIQAALLATNMQQCNPPLSDDEVRAIARSVARYAPGAPNDVLGTLTDAGNADRFARRWGEDLRYVPELKGWLIWNGAYWRRDSVGAVMEMAKVTAREIYAEGSVVEDSAVCKKIAAHSNASQQAARLKAMLELAESIPALVVPVANLDANRWLLGVENGTLDLRQGCLVQAKREDYITTIAPIAFDPEAECPMFLKFLNEIMGGNGNMVAYLQRAFGYVLTGDISEQCLFFFYGTGANGKSTL
ncbi:MAG TPA: bifunctional DNA primase/polymerase, partial [Casimicrobiaceae bacterium]